MARRKPHRRQFGGSTEQHAVELTRSRNELRRLVKSTDYDLDAGDCSGAESTLLHAAIFAGRSAVHFDATSPYVATGGFTRQPEFEELQQVNKRFRAVCVRGRIKKG